ncbi:MAG: hypothetical protein HRT82_00535 [Henriciella sp.]|nr:hypothetical protein [Henriciella sp.]
MINFRTINLTIFSLMTLGAALAAFSIIPKPADSEALKWTWFTSSVVFSGAVGVTLAWRQAQKAAWLASLLLLSGASQLWLSDATWFKTYQVQSFGTIDRVAYFMVATHGLVSAAVLLLDPEKWLIRSVRGLSRMQYVRLGILFGTLMVLSVSILNFVGTYDRIGYAVQLIVGGGVVAASVLGVAALLFASDIDRAEIFESLMSIVNRHAFTMLPILFLVLSSAYALIAFGTMPVVEDETAYLFQARTLSEGAVYAPSLPEGTAEHFEFYLLVNNQDGWFATTVLGWPLVLALGVLIGLPWIVNPALGALSIWLGMSFWRRVTNRNQAIILGLLMVSSPWLLETSASLMTHAIVLALTLGAWCLIVEAKEHAAQQWQMIAALALLAGLFMGWIFLTRVVEGLLIGGLTGIWMLWHFGRQKRFLPVLAYGLGCFITGAIYFWYNLHTTGDMMLTPLQIYLDEVWNEDSFGFGPNVGPEDWGLLDAWPGHSPLEGLINLDNGLHALNTELHGWTIGSLALMLIYLIWRRPRGAKLAMLILAIAVIVMHFFYWFTGTFYIGARYWFGAFFAFIALSAAGFQALRGHVGSDVLPITTGRLNAVLILLCGFSLVVFATWRGAERYYPRTQDARIIASFEPPETVAANAILIMPCLKVFDKAMHLNDPFLRENRPIYVIANASGSTDVLERAFPDRDIYEANELSHLCED